MCVGGGEAGGRQRIEGGLRGGPRLSARAHLATTPDDKPSKSIYTTATSMARPSVSPSEPADPMRAATHGILMASPGDLKIR